MFRSLRDSSAQAKQIVIRVHLFEVGIKTVLPGQKVARSRCLAPTAAAHRNPACCACTHTPPPDSHLPAAFVTHHFAGARRACSSGTEASKHMLRYSTPEHAPRAAAASTVLCQMISGRRFDQGASRPCQAGSSSSGSDCEPRLNAYGCLPADLWFSAPQPGWIP